LIPAHARRQVWSRQIRDEVTPRPSRVFAYSADMSRFPLEDPLRRGAHRPSFTTGDRLFLGDGGEMGAAIRAYPWEASSLGPPEVWPQSLRTAVRLILTSRHPMFIWWGPQLIQFYNDAYSQTMGPERHPSALGQAGRDCWAEIWPIVGPQIDFVMNGEGSTWHEDQLVPVTRHGGLKEVWWTYGYSPIDDGDRVGGVLVVCKDVTDEHLTKETLDRTNAGLRGDLGRLRSLFEQAPGFMAVLRGADHVFEQTNGAYQRLIGRDNVLGQSVRQAVPEVEGQGFLDLLDSVFLSGEPHVGAGVALAIESSTTGLREQRYIDFVYQPIRAEDGSVEGIFVEGHDVTSRVRAIHDQKLIVDEMNHRVKNILANVQSLLMLTAKSSSTVEELKTVLTDRLQAMAKTQDLLLRDYGVPVRVSDIITAELAPYLDVDGQLDFSCAPMTLGPDGALSLGLLVHELLTNAAKYGALASPHGRLAIRCELVEGEAVITWRETPAELLKVIDHRGFGTQLIERLARNLRGSAQIDMQPAGLCATIVFPVAR
jgi:two-component sensor histidine kinase